MTVKDWMEEEQGKHFCQCGCGGEIVIKPRHHSKTIPEYIQGHGGHYKIVDGWIKEEQGKHFCQCGCGGEIKILKYHHHCSTGIPKYIRGHTPPSEEAKHKMREAMKGENNPMYGKHHAEKAKRKIGDAHKGEKNWNYGKHPSEETKRKMRENHADFTGENHPMYGKHPAGRVKTHEEIEKMRKSLMGHPVSEETKQKIREKRKHRKYPKHHTKPELIFEEICKKYDLHFKYVGDSSLWIGKKNNSINPDFIQADGQKIVVEIFGEYWHSLLINPKLSKTANLDYRKNHYKKYGWESYFIWDTDLLRPDAEQFVLNLLKGVGTPK